MKRSRSTLSFATLAVAICSLTLLRGTPDDALTLAAPKLVRAGSHVDLLITLRTSSKDVFALQWQVSVPNEMNFEASSALEDKQLRCYQQRCILYGGQNPISSGVIAHLRANLPGSSSAELLIGLRDVLEATSDGMSRKIAEAGLVLKPIP